MADAAPEKLVPAPDAALRDALGPPPRGAQLRALGASWFVYASYYLGRKGFGVVKSRLSADFGLDPAALAVIDTGYLLAYAVGQLPSGLAVDRWGPRRVVG